RVYYKPFIRWIWFGGLFMALGGVLCMLDPRYRLRKSAPANNTSAKSEAE
ncbi:MAG: cytochrome c-type biogenesis CcmF C-terminal domain-containing protein, partial [Plesiomonas sp.]